MADYVTVKINISDKALKKLLNGNRVQLKHGDLINGSVELVMSKRQAKKITTSIKNQKGVRIQFDPVEIEHNGQVHGGRLSWKGFKRGLAKVGKVAMPIIKKVATAILDNGGEQALQAGLSALAVSTGNPELVPAAIGGVKVARQVMGVGDCKTCKGGKVKIPKGLKKVGNAVLKIGKKVAKAKALKYLEDHGDEMVDAIVDKSSTKIVDGLKQKAPTHAKFIDEMTESTRKGLKQELKQELEKQKRKEALTIADIKPVLKPVLAVPVQFNFPYQDVEDLKGVGKKRGKGLYASKGKGLYASKGKGLYASKGGAVMQIMDKPGFIRQGGEWTPIKNLYRGKPVRAGSFKIA